MVESNMLICKYCRKECKNKNSLRNHERTCPSNVNRVYKNGMTGKKGRNQHMKAKELGIASYGTMSDNAKERLRILASNRTHTTETKEKLSRFAKERSLGGHTSKQRLYFKKKNGDVVYLQSSYEVKFATLLEELCVEWSRPEPLMWTDDAGVDHRYYPDFKIGHKYADTKNDYLVLKDKDKIDKVSSQNNVIVEVVTLNNITKEYIQSVFMIAPLVK